MPGNGVVKFKAAHANHNMMCYWSVDKHYILAPENSRGETELEYFVILLWLNGKLSCGEVILKADKVNTFAYRLRHFCLCLAHIASFELRYCFQFSFVKILQADWNSIFSKASSTVYQRR